MSLAAFLAFAGLVLFAVVSPGPAVLMSARTGLTEGFRTGVMLALGIASGAVVWALAAMFGLHLIFDAAPSLGELDAEVVRNHAIAGLAALGAGVVEGARDLTAGYIKGREQFGRSLARPLDQRHPRLAAR